MNISHSCSIALRTFLILALWAGHDSMALGQSPPSDAAGTKRALLIGINKYKAVPTLQGSLNDIDTMRQILVTRWGFSEKHISVLTDEAGTRAGILAALEQLVKDAGPNDTVYFHYSGHGSQVEDVNGDEPDDHLDETLVPHDGRTDDIRDITDDELDAVFARLRAKTALLVLDSCHSGTATRSLDIRTRSIPRDPRVDLYKKAEASTPQTRAIVPVVTSRYVVMTGAAAHQEALDGPVDGRYHGFFTYALSKSLSASSQTATPREVFSGVERELKRIQTHFGRSSMPEPQLEAPPDLIERALLGTHASAGMGSENQNSARLAWLQVIAGEQGLITLVNGTLLGAAPGSTWSIYAPHETRFVPGRALAVATVTQIMGKDSTAKVQSSAGNIPSGARAVALLPAPAGHRIPIRILNVPPDRRAIIEETLCTNLRDVDIVGPDKPARFSVDTEGAKIRLLTADGLQVMGIFGLNESWGAGLATVVSRSANASELLTLDNPSSQLRLDVRVATSKTPRPKVNTRGITVVGDTQAAVYRIRQQGSPRTQQNSLQLEIRASADSYVTIVDVDSEGGINLLFPNNYRHANFIRDGFVHAETTVLIPDSIRPGNQAGFYWDYSPPTGTDTIRVFTSTDLQTAEMIRDHINSLRASVAQASGGFRTRSVAEGVHSLRQSLARVATRGFTEVYDPTSHVPTETPSGSQNQPVVPLQGNTGLDATSEEPASGPPADWTATTITIVIAGDR